MIQPGSKLGHYEIASPLGKGGMGEVWRARDTKLGRDVAIKTLPAEFAEDTDRLARFEREARLLASLNHPNIASIYGLEEHEGARFLVLELVEGDTLDDRLKAGAMRVDDSLRVALEIAEALEAAHEKGVIHRDLKPANIKLASGGAVKVLDFGLAKALDADPAEPGLSNSPTLSMAATRQGVILGTAAYMSPEQARGDATDARTDVWAFGCVLYEMLTGRQTWAGRTVTDIIGGIVAREPDWTLLPPTLHPRVRFLLERCLNKEVKDRCQTITEARAEIRKALTEPAATVPVGAGAPASRPGRRALGVAVVAAIVLGGVALAVFLRGGRETTNPADGLLRFEVSIPDGFAWVPTDGYVALSPDGRTAAFSTAASGIWIRDMESLESRQLDGTEGALSPFWSPDSRFIAFSVGRALKKVDIRGGPVQTLTEVDQFNVGSGSWSDDDIIIFGSRGTGNGIFQVPAVGGVATQVTVKSGTQAFHALPSFLPNGRDFLYLAVEAGADDPQNGMYVGSLDRPPDQQSTERLFPALQAASFQPASTDAGGNLFFILDTTLMVQAFDVDRLELVGEPAPLAERVSRGSSHMHASVSASGDLLYAEGNGQPVSLVDGLSGVPAWVDRMGEAGAALAAEPLAGARNPRLSPDGERLALIIAGDLWVYNVDGRPPIRLTFDGSNSNPLWTRDGSRIVYRSAAPPRLRLLPADGSDSVPEEVSPDGIPFSQPGGWSADGTMLVATYNGGETGADIGHWPVDDPAEVTPLVRTPAAETLPAVSPDGNWLAYTSDTTGTPEIWVRPYPGPGAPVRVSPNRGADPVWSPDGSELYYIEPLETVPHPLFATLPLMAVEVDTSGGTFDFEAPTRLFDIAFRGSLPVYDVDPEGRFVVIRGDTDASESQDPFRPRFIVVRNWAASLEGRP